jgi:hypothetical protein
MLALDKTAKKLSFDLSAEKVDEIFKRDEEFFSLMMWMRARRSVVMLMCKESGYVVWW